MTTLGEVCAMNPRPLLDELPSDETEVSFVPMAAVEEETGRMDASQVRTLAAVSKGYMPFKENDVVFAKITPCMENGKVALASGLRNGLGYGSTEFFVFRPFLGVLPRFILHFLLHPSFRNDAQVKMTGGVGHQRVPSKYLFTHPFPLPPTREQERIVAKLETMLARINKGEAAARRALDRLKRYRAAVLHAAVTGELTLDWRKTHKPEETGTQLQKRLLQERRVSWETAELKRLRDAGKPTNDDTWKMRYPEPTAPKTSDIHDVPRSWALASVEQLNPGDRSCAYGVLQPGPHFPRGVQLVRVGDINEGQVSLEGIKRIAPRIAAMYERTKLQGGELLITLVGAIGRTAVVPDALIGANTARAVGVVPLSPSVSSDWVELWFRSPSKRNEMVGKAHEVARKTLNLEDVRSAAVPLPPLEEQLEAVREVHRRFASADRLATTLNRQLDSARATRHSLLREAFTGKLVPQDPEDEPASGLLAHIRAARVADAEAQTQDRKSRGKTTRKRIKETAEMNQSVPTIDALQKAWQKIGKKVDAHMIFQAAGFGPGTDQAVSFYELLRSAGEILEAFKSASKDSRPVLKALTVRPSQAKQKSGRFRLGSLWLEDFKNLKNYKVDFNSAHGLDIVLGWNGTGKSNLFESLVIIFRSLHYWSEKNKWSEEPLAGYRLSYEIEDKIVEVTWNPAQMKRPAIRQASLPKEDGTELKFEPVRREDLLLPKFVFGYYSGPTNRLADHFWPMKRDHYHLLRKTTSDDPHTLAMLLEQRRFFCAESSHAKFVLLAFSHKKDTKIWKFLEKRLRITGFESALFIIRKPRWAKPKSTPQDFWGATGIMSRVMEKLRHFAVAPMVLEQKVADGYSLRKEEHYYFFLPNLESLHEFAAEYADARSFFLALESTDFSDLIHDLKIQVRVKAAQNQEISVTFRELSEGEQQLLMVLGLMRFTKSHQSLVLLDEPDTHLNPHWSVEYLKDLVSVTSDDDKPSPEQQTSQTLLATHDPLVIASLLKEQVHLLKRNRDSLQCYWQQASENPRGLGYTGILLSGMFGFSSDLDEETLALLTRQVELAGKPERLSSDEKNELDLLNKQIEKLGFKTVSSDPYYRSFIEALTRRQDVLELIQKPEQTTDERARIDKAADEILAELAQKHAIKI